MKNVCVTVPFLLCFPLYLRPISKYKPTGAYIRRSISTEGFLRYEFGGGGGLYLEGPIPEGTYFRNFTVYVVAALLHVSVNRGLVP